jgi:hypothetical protein
MLSRASSRGFNLSALTHLRDMSRLVPLTVELAMNNRVKEVVSRKAIKREIGNARKKLIKLERTDPKSLSEREAIFRQLIQLELCEKIINDIHIL